MSVASTASSPNINGANGGPSPLACLECRRRHLKCDAKQPCSRCIAADIESQCLYVSSRRGYQGPSASRKKQRLDSQPNQQFSDHTPPNGVEETTPKSAQVPFATMFASAAEDDPYMLSNMDAAESNNGIDSMLFGNVFPCQSSVQTIPWMTAATQPWTEQSNHNGLMTANTPMPQKPTSKSPRLIELYYIYFHNAHPILPPKRFLERLPQLPDCLRCVVEFIGSQFDPSENSETLKGRAHMILKMIDRSFFRVQAFLLFAIALHARNEQQDSMVMLNSAVDLALDVGLHERSFLDQHRAKGPIMLESIRRTWWELYIVDGMLASLHQFNEFKSNSVKPSMELPCEEDEFEAGCRSNLPPQMPSELDDRAFSDVEIELSSYSHRIEAVQILARVIAVANNVSDAASEVESVDSLLSSWGYLLSPSKSEIVNHDGSIDEMLFQAQMFIHCATIFLHLPRSGMIASTRRRMENECARRLGGLPPTTTTHDHSVKANNAANEISRLASIRTDVNRHTPFFICALVMATVVQMSACSISACKCLKPNRERIIQAIGLLRSLGKIWPIAYRVLQQVRRVAADLLRTGTQPEPKPSSTVPLIRTIDDMIIGDMPFDLPEATDSLLT